MKVIQNHTHTEKETNEQDNVHHEKQNQKLKTIQKRQTQKYLKEERKNRKMIKNLPQESRPKQQKNIRRRNHFLNAFLSNNQYLKKYNLKSSHKIFHSFFKLLLIFFIDTFEDLIIILIIFCNIF